MGKAVHFFCGFSKNAKFCSKNLGQKYAFLGLEKLNAKSEIDAIFCTMFQLENIVFLQCEKTVVMNSTRENILNSIKALGMKVLPKDAQLILFGSQARKDAHAESDWDLLILLGNNHQSADMFGLYAYPFVQLGWEYGTYFSPKVYTFTEWTQRKGTPFYENINREGVVLC